MTRVLQGFEISDRLAAGCLRKQPAGGEGTGGYLFFWSARRTNRLCRYRSQKSVRINRQLRSPISFRGHLAPLSRRPYQPENRFSSVSRPFLNVSGAASPLRRGALLRTAPRVPLARIYQTATIGPAGLYCWLDCACAGVGRRGVGSGMWL